MTAYGTVGQAIARGDVPYRDVFDHKQPLIYLPYWALGVAFPFNTSAIRILAAIVAALTSMVVFLISRRLGRYAGLVACALYVLLSASPLLEGADLNAEHLLTLTGSMTIWSALWASEVKSRVPAVVVGICLGLAVLTKAVAVFIAIPALIGVLWGTKGLKDRLARIGWMGLGGALPIGVTLVAFSYWRGLQHFVHANVAFNAQYVRKSTIESLMGWAVSPRYVLIMMAISGLAGLVAVVKGRERPYPWIILTWLLAALVGAKLGRRDYGHYFVPVLAPAIAMLVAGIVSTPRRGMMRWAVHGLGIAIFAATLFLPTAKTFQMTPDQFSIFTYTGAKVWIRQEEVGAWLRTNARRSDTLFVAGSEPGFYWASGLRPASRYIYDSVRNIETRFEQEVRDALVKQRPAFLILPEEDRPDYLSFTDGWYEEVHSEGSISVLRLTH